MLIGVDRSGLLERRGAERSFTIVRSWGHIRVRGDEFIVATIVGRRRVVLGSRFTAAHEEDNDENSYECTEGDTDTDSGLHCCAQAAGASVVVIIRVGSASVERSSSR